MNQHNEHILMRYVKTEQSERDHAAQAWQAASGAVNPHILKAGVAGAALLALVVAVFLVGLM